MSIIKHTPETDPGWYREDHREGWWLQITISHPVGPTRGCCICYPNINPINAVNLIIIALTCDLTTGAQFAPLDFVYPNSLGQATFLPYTLSESIETQNVYDGYF